MDCFLIGAGSLPLECGKLLLERGDRINGVISTDPSLHRWALDRGIPATEPRYLKKVLSQKPFDYLFSIANAKILGPDILALPRQATINYHNAPLPRYGGTNAVSWGILHQEQQWGVTWHLVSSQIDGGDLLKQKFFALGEDDTALSVHGKCYEAGLESFDELLGDLKSKSAVRTRQDPKQRTYFTQSQRPSAACAIFWSRPAREIRALVRALNLGGYANPLGLPKIKVGNDWLLVPKLEVRKTSARKAPGTILALEGDRLKVSTATEDVVLSELQTIDGEPLPISELITRYDLHVGDRLPELEERAKQQIEEVDRAIAKHENFWVKRLASLAPPPLPNLNAQPASPSQYRSASISLPSVLFSFCTDRGLHPGDFLFAAFAVYLARISKTNQFDLGLNDPSLDAKLEKVFAAYRPCRLQLDPNASFSEAFQSATEQAKKTQKCGTFARDLVARYPQLSSVRGLVPQQHLPIAVRRVSSLPSQLPDSNPLTLTLTEDGRECCWFYDAAAIADEAVARLSAQWLATICSILENDRQPLTRLSLLPAAERQKLLYDWNDTAAPYSEDACMHELFEAQVERNPDSVAVISENQQLTYRELNARANQLACHLRNLGVKAEVLVGVYLGRSPDTIVAVLAVLKAGGAYIPLDPRWPEERIQGILATSKALCAISQSSLLPTLQAASKQCPQLQHLVCLDARCTEFTVDSGECQDRSKTALWTSTNLQSFPTENLPTQITSDNLAYIIYTSGSTGVPKGVMVRHKPAINLIEWVNNTFQVNSEDRLLFVTSLCFDLSVYDIFGILAAGGSIRIATETDIQDPKRLFHLLRDEGITFWDSAPAVLQQLAPLLDQDVPHSGRSRLRLAFCSGDWIPVTLPDRVRRAFPDTQVVSLGGATEATIWSNYYPIDRVDPNWKSIPYGKPIQNAKYYILDEQLNPCPVGIVGELYIGGPCLSSGYFNNPEKTSQSFRPNPFAEEEGELFYRTGDLARYQPDGNMEFLGRIDRQVKIRGFRIELGEIQSILSKHSAVRESLVSVWEDGEGNKHLVAYFVPKEMETVSLVELRRFLQRKLPDYMLPTYFVTLGALPLTANGKIDRAALPSPAATQVQSEFVAPKVGLESQLAAIWQQAFQRDRIGRDDDFLDLGGHSLLAARIAGEVEQTLKLSLPPATLMQYSTIAQLADRLDTAEKTPTCPSLAIIKPGGAKPPLFCIHALGRGLELYRPLARHLDPEQPLYGLSIQLTQAEETVVNRVENLATYYIEQMRSLQPEGPYFLAGVSVGGTIAFEMAQQLTALGETVAFVGLLDTRIAGGRKTLSRSERLDLHLQGYKQKGLNYIRRLGHQKWRNWVQKVQFSRYRINRQLGRPLSDRLVELAYIKSNQDICQRYTPQFYTGAIALFRAKDGTFFEKNYLDLKAQWSVLAGGGLDFYEIPGDHLGMLREPHVRVLAERLTACLKQATLNSESAYPTHHKMAAMASK